MDIETKLFNGVITEVKQIERNGVEIGIIAGYIATWDLDRGNEQFIKGAFAKSIQEHKDKKRQIRFKDHHGRTVGGYPIDQVKEDEKGLFGVAEVNLEVQQGRELHSLARQGVIVDKSIGFTAIEEDRGEDGRRLIKEAIVWEGSGVDEPMNEDANIVEVKGAIEKATTPEELKNLLLKIRTIPEELVESIVKCLTEKESLNYEDLKDCSDRELEEKLKTGICFSGKSAKVIIATLKAAGLRDEDGDHRDDGFDWGSVVAELKKTKQLLEGKSNDT